MTKKPESRFGARLIKETSPEIHWTRIESWALPGVPDLHGLLDEVAFWLELKVSDLPNVGNSSRMGARPHQIQWQQSYTRAGGRVWNLIHRPSSKLMDLTEPFSLSQDPLLVYCTLPVSKQGFEDLLYELKTLVKTPSS
jgi:hypothetical protein